MYAVPVLRRLEQDDLEQLQELIESDPGYTERVTGHPPGASDALSLAIARPDGVPEEAKAVLGAWAGPDSRPRMVGVVDLVRGYPEPGRVFVGLLQVRWELQREGLGSTLWAEAEQWVLGEWPETAAFRCAVVDTNARVAEPFWRRMGFAPTGETQPYRYDKLESTARLYERPAPEPGPR